MNVIFIQNDTLRRDHVHAYGAPAPWDRPGHEGEPFIQTPYLDRLAAESAVFERFYCSSFATIPCRWDEFTGRYGFPFRGWQPIDPGDVIMSEIVRQHGYTSMLLFDTPPMGTDEFNYTRGYSGWQWVRGHHLDRYVTAPVPIALPAAPYKLKNVEAVRLYLRNMAGRKYEREWMVGRTMSAAMDWLEENHTLDGFLLWIDAWTPHEPFEAPSFYMARYADPNFRGDAVIYPRYGRCEYMTPGELNHVRAAYAAMITMSDRWIGRLLEKVDALGLLKNTLIIHTTDHGHNFGDRGIQGKCGPLYETIAHLPLMIRHPDGVGAGKRIPAIAQHPDLLPTILEFLDVPIPETVQGKSLWPLITGQADRMGDCAVSSGFIGTEGGVSLLRQTFGRARAFDGHTGVEGRIGPPITLTTEDWALICPPGGGQRRELYDLRQDPHQLNNLIAERPETADALQKRLVDFLEEIGTPEQRLQRYRPGFTVPERGSYIRPEQVFYAIQDDRGRTLAFRTLFEAQECLVPPVPGHKVCEVTFGELVAEDPKALISVGGQYYWAQDLA
jgi:arylsulfatase A-like enzyme